MKHPFRLLLLAAASLVGLAVFAQPAPPYPVVISGTVVGCMPNSQVTIETMGGTQPAFSFTLDLVNCGFDTVAYMDTPGGGFVFNVPCNGMMLSAVGQYQVNFLGGDSVYVALTCGNGVPDCLGVPGGSALPGTPCGNPNGINGTWNANCECVPDTSACQACIELGPVVPPNGNAIPFAVLGTNCSLGASPITYQINWGDGVTNSAGDHVYAAPGTYGVCITIADGNGCTSVACDTVHVDADGGVSTGPTYFDCLQIPNGPNLPGTPCDDGDPATINDVWGPDCSCSGSNTGVFCQAGITVGQNAAWEIIATGTGTGTAPLYFEWSLPNGTTITGGTVIFPITTPGIHLLCLTVTDSEACTVTTCDSLYVDSLGMLTNGPTYFDCLQVPNGPNLPGTPCNNPNGVAGTWNTNCECIPNTIGCQAGFWVIQAYEGDSLNGQVTPIPYELWVWNLSNGTSPFQFLWSFGDGTTSTDPYPTHVYAQSGPYLLCLTMTDAAGCSSTSCDSVSIDGDGLYEGMAPVDGEARNGFTIRVVDQMPTAIADQPAFADTRLWPNPVNEVLNLRFNTSVRGNLPISVVDVNGRVVLVANAMLAGGHEQLEIPTGTLPAGMYLLRMGTDRESMSFRFVKN